MILDNKSVVDEMYMIVLPFKDNSDWFPACGFFMIATGWGNYILAMSVLVSSQLTGI